MIEYDSYYVSHIFDSSIGELVIFYLKNPSQRLHDKYKDFEDTEEVSVRPLRTILLNCLFIGSWMHQSEDDFGIVFLWH